MNSSTNLWRSLLLALLIVWLPNIMMAAEKSDDLQEFITKSASTLTRASDVIEVVETEIPSKE